MDSDGDNTIDVGEFERYFLRLKARHAATPKGGEAEVESNLERVITKESLARLFKALDVDRSGSLDLQEFINYIGYQQEYLRKTEDNIDAATMAGLNLQIDRLFRKVDADQSGYIDLTELWKLLRHLKPGFSLADCKHVVKQHDANFDGNIDQTEFAGIVKELLLEHLSRPLDDVEDFRAQLKKIDHKRNGRVTIDALMELLTKHFGVEKVQMSDMRSLAKYMNQMEDTEEIEAAELITLVQNCGSIAFAERAAADLHAAEDIRAT